MDMHQLEDQYIRIQSGIQQARCICELLNECGLPRDAESRDRYHTFAWLLEEILVRTVEISGKFGDELFNSSPAAH